MREREQASFELCGNKLIVGCQRIVETPRAITRVAADGQLSKGFKRFHQHLFINLMELSDDRYLRRTRRGDPLPQSIHKAAPDSAACRELERRLRVWVRRCREEKQPLLSEWIPPTEDQTRMSRALGEARAWQQIAAVRQARWVKACAAMWLTVSYTGVNQSLHQLLNQLLNLLRVLSGPVRL